MQRLHSRDAVVSILKTMGPLGCTADGVRKANFVNVGRSIVDLHGAVDLDASWRRFEAAGVECVLRREGSL